MIAKHPLTIRYMCLLYNKARATVTMGKDMGYKFNNNLSVRVSNKVIPAEQLPCTNITKLLSLLFSLGFNLSEWQNCGPHMSYKLYLTFVNYVNLITAS